MNVVTNKDRTPLICLTLENSENLSGTGHMCSLRVAWLTTVPAGPERVDAAVKSMKEVGDAFCDGEINLDGTMKKRDEILHREGVVQPCTEGATAAAKAKVVKKRPGADPEKKKRKTKTVETTAKTLSNQ